MPIIAGIDEAGYGPTLGPFVLSKVVMEIPDGYHHETNIWHLLKDAVSEKIQKRGNRIIVGDSKKLYQQKTGLKMLEEAVLSFVWHTKGPVTKFTDLLKLLSGCDDGVLEKYPWYQGKDLDLPVASNVSAIMNYADIFNDTANLRDVRILDIKSRFMCVSEINRQLEILGNKSLLLFEECVAHLNEIFEYHGAYKPKVLIDKHGGRNYYEKLLAQNFEGCNIDSIVEGNPLSTYCVKNENKTMDVSFIVGADSKYFPTALASMFSKYIRELFIKLFNTFWQEKVQDIKPTAGYPEDARRFLSQIHDIKNKLNISDDILIRTK